MPTTRSRTLFLAVPLGLVLGVFGIVSEIVDHGLSAAVVSGLFAGGFLGAALILFVHHFWSRPRSYEERRRTREAAARSRPLAVGAGLVAAGLASAIGGLTGGTGHAAGILAMSAIGVLFVVAAGIVALTAILRPDFWR